MWKINSKEQNIFWTSDTHYWHNNITYGVSVWPDKEKNTRKFDTVQEMSRHMVDQINKYVGEDDILFHLGDWSFGGIANIWNFRHLIKCKNIYLIFGNHDTHIQNNIVLPNCIRQEPYSSTIIYGKNTDPEYPNYVEAQTLFKSVSIYSEIEIDKVLICMMHYPIESWNNHSRHSLHLHGHTHGRLPVIPYRLDVGIDNAYNLFKEYRPFTWEDIKKYMKK